MKKCYALVVLIFILIATHAQWKGFQPITSYAVANNVNLIHTKDVTGDGVPDLLALYTANTTNWALLSGRGNGTFQPFQSFVKEDNYFLSDIADLNADGFSDMVISSYWNNGFLIYFGRANGPFQKGPFMYTGTHGRAVKCVDINKDGKMDIVGTTSGSGRTISLHVFLGKGDGTFEDKKTFPSILDSCKELFITDMNNDGLLDVVSTSSFHWLVIFVQKADGGFEPVYHPTFQAARAAFSDINQDGKEDLLLLYPSFDNMPNSDSLVIRLNNGTDYASSSIRVPAFDNRKVRPYLIRVADINKDGFTDLVFNHTNQEGEYTDSLFYMLGKGAAQFESPVAMIMPGKVLYITLADLNDDTWVDLVVSCDNKTVNVILNQFNKPVNEPGQMHIYPNPAAVNFFVEAPIHTLHTIHLYNAAGQLVHTQTTASTRTSVSAYGLSSGIYYVEISGKEVHAKQAVLLQ